MNFSKDDVEYMQELLLEGYRFIARNKKGHRELYAYKTKPIKCIDMGFWFADDWYYTDIPRSCFDFIKWEDEEPFYIGDLFDIIFKEEIE